MKNKVLLYALIAVVVLCIVAGIAIMLIAKHPSATPTALSFNVQPLVVSDIKTVHVQQVNYPNLQNTLEAMGFYSSYQPIANATRYPTLAPGQTLHLQIHFTDIVQPIDQMTVPGKNDASGQPIVYSGYGDTYDQNTNTITVNLYQHPDAIAAIQTPMLATVFWQQTLMALWEISHQSQIPTTTQDYEKIALQMQVIAKQYPVIVLAKTQ